MSDEERARAIARDPRYGRIVCRCCQVTEGRSSMRSTGRFPPPTLMPSNGEPAR